METYKTLKDIHTHTPAPGALYSVDAYSQEPPPSEGYFSIGFHPWGSSRMPDTEEWQRFETLAQDPRCLAIGECGIDIPKGGPLYLQMNLLRQQAELAERLGKPLIIHSVKAHDQIAGMRREMHPVQEWIIHGFRGKPSIARIFLDAGCSLSFGDRYNPESFAITPPDRRYSETD